MKASLRLGLVGKLPVGILTKSMKISALSSSLKSESKFVGPIGPTSSLLPHQTGLASRYL